MMANHTRHFKIGVNGYSAWNLFPVLIFRKGPDQVELKGLFDFLVSGMRFTYEPVRNKNIGLGGLLNRSEIDIAMAYMGVTEENMKAYNLNYPFCIEDVTFSTRNPEYSPRIMALFQTLSLTVWLWLLASTILFTLVCHVALKHRHTFQDVFLHVLAICLNQEGNVVSKRAGEFILLCTWLVAMALFSLCFKSVLLSFLSFPPLNSVRTVPELAAAIRAGEYIAYSYYGTDIPETLSQSTSGDIRLIVESILKQTEQNVYRVEGSGFTEIELFDNALPKKAYVDVRSRMSIPGLYVSKDSLFTVSFATAVPKDSCFKDEVDMLVHRFMASGIGEKIRHFREYVNTFFHYQDFGSENIKLEKAEEVENRQLTMTDLGGAFILLVVGHFLSFCVLIIELVVKRRKASASLPKQKMKRCI